MPGRVVKVWTEAGPQQALAHAPALQPVQLYRQRVLDLVGAAAQADAQPLAQERTDGMLQEPHQVGQLHDGIGAPRQRSGQERRVRPPLAGEGQYPVDIEVDRGRHRMAARRPTAAAPDDRG